MFRCFSFAFITSAAKASSDKKVWIRGRLLGICSFISMLLSILCIPLAIFFKDIIDTAIINLPQVSLDFASYTLQDILTATGYALSPLIWLLIVIVTLIYSKNKPLLDNAQMNSLYSQWSNDQNQPVADTAGTSDDNASHQPDPAPVAAAAAIPVALAAQQDNTPSGEESDTPSAPEKPIDSEILPLSANTASLDESQEEPAISPRFPYEEEEEFPAAPEASFSQPPEEEVPEDGDSVPDVPEIEPIAQAVEPEPITAPTAAAAASFGAAEMAAKSQPTPSPSSETVRAQAPAGRSAKSKPVPIPGTRLLDYGYSESSIM